MENKCRICDEPIVVGNYWTDRAGTYIHYGCITFRNKKADREDWLKIYCSVIEAKLPLSGSNFHQGYIKAYVQYTNELFEAFKERWAEE